jgi:hypothetical protein
MSYDLTLECGCIVYVSCNPTTGVAHTRVLDRRSLTCKVRNHEVGMRLYLWDLLPDRGRVDTPARGERHALSF